MITFFQGSNSWFAVETQEGLTPESRRKLVWLFGKAKPADQEVITGRFIGPRKEMVTPWSTNAVEITQNMGINGITRIEEFTSHQSAVRSPHPSVHNPQSTNNPADSRPSSLDPPPSSFDPMLQQVYENLDQQLYFIDNSQGFGHRDGVELLTI